MVVQVPELNFFNLANLSSRTMALGVASASNRNEYQIVSLRSRALPARQTGNLTAICEQDVWTMWDPQHLITL
jgi:hypothetical protein